MGFLSSIGKGIAKTLDTLTVALAHPIATATAVVSKKSTVQDVITSHFAQPLGEQIKDIVVGTAGIAAGVLAAGTTTGAAISIKAAKYLAPKTVKGAVVSGAVGLVAIPALIASPKATKELISAPSSLVSIGTNIGEFVESPSISKAKDIFLDNPIASGIIAGGAALAAAPLIIPAASAALTREKIGDVEEAIKAAPTIVAQPATPIVSAMPATVADAAIVSQNSAIPILPEDKLTTTKRRSYKKRKPVAPIRITNRNINKLVAVIK